MNEYDNNNSGLDTGSPDTSPYDSNPNHGATETGSGGGKVQPVPISTLGDISRSKAVTKQFMPHVHTLTNLLDVPISLVFEVGRTSITIAHLMELRAGSFIDLRNVLVDVIDVRVNDKIIAEAEAISLQQRYGIRISEITRMPGADEGQNDV